MTMNNQVNDDFESKKTKLQSSRVCRLELVRPSIHLTRGLTARESVAFDESHSEPLSRLFRRKAMTSFFSGVRGSPARSS